MITAAEVLRATEAGAEAATLQELRVMIRDTMKLLPELPPRDHRLAAGLLEKLQRLADARAAHDEASTRPPFPGEAWLVEDAQACVDALLDGLSGWLRGDVHPRAVPKPLVSDEAAPPRGGAAPAPAGCAAPIGRLAVLAAAAMSRSSAAQAMAHRPPPSGPAAEAPQSPGLVGPPLLGRRLLACGHCRWTLWLPGCCAHAVQA